MMKYFLGIDGGGTKTKVCLIDETGTILGYGNGGPSSIDTVDALTTFTSIKNALQEISSLPMKPFHLHGIFAGLGGVVTQNDKISLSTLLLDLPYTDASTQISVDNDAINALASGELGQAGMVLIVGTGMVAYGQNPFGQTHKAGGWGYKEGDAGSSYDLGVQALKTLSRAFDKRIETSNFIQALAHHVGMKNSIDIIPIMDQYWGQRTLIASLAPFVTKFANLGDYHAKAIIDKATDELALCVRAVYQNITYPNAHLVVVGSLGNADGYFKDQLHQKIQAISPLIKIIAPSIDPAYAAAKLALNHNQ